jgi:hypothetical protein
MLRSNLILAIVMVAMGAGADIASADSFAYDFYDQTLFHGVFDGAQSASGTLRFYDHAANGVKACDTGVISWTAHTTAAPAQGGGPRPVPGGRYLAMLPDGGRLSFSVSSDGTLIDEFGVSNVHGDTCSFTGGWAYPGWPGTPINVDNGSAGGTGNPHGGGGPHATTTRYGARVRFGRLSRTRVGGRIRVFQACLAGRTVYLYDGRRRVARTLTARDGSFTFREVRGRHKRLMRASVTGKSLRGSVCAAASSGFTLV